ncbi:hypothetical protein WJX79_009954 [Trebouxia sp. C0005]
MAKFTCDITCYNDYTGSALLHEATLWSDKTTTSSDVVTAKKDSSSTDVHTKVAMLVKDEMSSRRFSQTHDNVHLTEAARKARDGDSKLEDLLHWAIENSDPDQLKQQAENVATDSIYLNDRQREVQQLIKEMQSAPTEIDLMKDTIAILTNSTTPAEEVLLALEALQSLVEPIDNANDLHTLQGLQPVVQLLVQDSTSVQAAAAFVLGTAASNNNKFQEQLMELYPESVMHLLRVTASSDDLSQLDLSSQASKAERQQLLAAIHPHACDGANNLASEALMAVKGVLECSDTDAKQLAEESGASSAIQSLKQGLKSHLNSICHVESYVVEDVQCKRDLLQMCNDIDNMPCLTAEDHTAKTTSKHQEL